jgi:hypothetical protein
MSSDKLVRFAEQQGYNLLPEQRDVLRAIEQGEVVSHPRRNGMETVRKIIADYNAATREP